jgi:hypothetical protein
MRVIGALQDMELFTMKDMSFSDTGEEIEAER